MSAVAADSFGWVVADGFRWFWMVLGGFGWFAVLVVTVMVIVFLHNIHYIFEVAHEKY